MSIEFHKYGDLRQVKVTLVRGQHRQPDGSGSFTLERPMILTVEQKWTRHPGGWDPDFWANLRYLVDTAEEVPEPPSTPEPPPKVGFWRSLFGMGPKLPKVTVVRE